MRQFISEPTDAKMFVLLVVLCFAPIGETCVGISVDILKECAAVKSGLSCFPW